MKINNFHESDSDNRFRVCATVNWEDFEHPPESIYFESDSSYAGILKCDPNAILLAAIMPAIHRGEKRILVEGKICPQLKDNLIAASRKLFCLYNKNKDDVIEIEASKGYSPYVRRQPERTALFLSGGIDSLCTLRINRLNFPLGHPRSIKDGIIVHGFDAGGPEAVSVNQENFKLTLSSISKISQDAGVTMIPLHTNIRQLEPRRIFFPIESCGAALSAVAHTFSSRVSAAMIASSANIFDKGLVASHPLLNPSYCSSSEMQIIYDGERYERLEKVGVVADWDVALQNLRVCNNPFSPKEILNCGKCAKCLLTMTGLLVYGKLKNCSGFPEEDVSADMIGSLHSIPIDASDLTDYTVLEKSARVISAGDLSFWKEMILPLQRLGRDDLTKVIESKLIEGEKYWSGLNGNNWKANIRSIDSKYLGNAMSGVYRFLKGTP